MLILLTLLTAGYFGAIIWLRGSAASQRAAAPTAAPTTCPVEDLPPVAAVGWPPGGTQFFEYVDQGCRALDAYLAEGFTS